MIINLSGHQWKPCWRCHQETQHVMLEILVDNEIGIQSKCITCGLLEEVMIGEVGDKGTKRESDLLEIDS